MLFKTKFEDKPPLGARPNLGHPVLQHAQRYYPMLEGSGWAKDYRSGYSALRANNASSTWEPGRYINSTGNNACFRTDANDYTIPTTGYVYLSYWWRWNGVLPGTGQWSYHVYCNDYTRFSVYMGAIGSQTVWRPYSRNQPLDASVNLYSQLSDKQWHHFLWRLRFSSTTSERVTHCWIDGTEYGPNTTGGSDVGGNTDMLAVNGRDDSTVRWSRGHMRDFILWYNTDTIPRLENEHLQILREQPYFAFQRPLPIWINTVGATTHEAASTYTLQKNISNSGIASYQASATYAIDKDIVSVGAGSLAANCIFALQHALSNDSAISIEAATSYALQNGLTLSAIMQRESAITLAVQKALQSSATSILNGNVSVDLSNALNVLGGLLLDGDASYALQSDLSNTADITLENSISLALQNALSNIADALLETNVNIGLEKTLTLNAVASLVSAVTLTHSLGYTSQRSSIYDTALTLAINAGITNAGELTGDLEAAVTYALQCSQSQSGAAVFAATSTLDLQNALLTVAAKILEGGITLSSTYLHSDTASRDIAGLITLGLTNNQITTALISLDCSVEYALNIFQQATAQATLQTNTTIDVQFELTSRGIDFDFGISDGGPTFTVQADITYEPTASTTKDVKIIH